MADSLSHRTELNSAAAESPATANADGASALLEEHGDYLYRFAIMRVKQSELAEDLVQETLLAAIRKWQTFEGRAAVRTWLTTILRNKIIDHFRRAAREARVVQTAGSGVELAEGLPGGGPVRGESRHFNVLGIWNTFLSDWAKQPDKLLEDRGLYLALQQCLAKLGETARRAFTMRVVDGYATEEVCKELSITASNLGVILYRSRMSLRDCLEATWIEGNK